MTCLYKDLQYSRNGMTRWKDKLKTLIYFSSLLLRSLFFGVAAGVRYGYKTARFYWKTRRISDSRAKPSDMRKTGGI